MKVLTTRFDHLKAQVWEGGYAPGFSRELAGDPQSTYQVLHSPEAADLIVVMESNLHTGFEHIPVLRRERLLVDYCAKVSVINYEDRPSGFLRGLYSSLEGPRFDPSLHKSWPAIYLHNEEVYDVGEARIAGTRPARLFTFVGSLSHPLRARLVERYSQPSPLYHVREVNKWFNHDPEERADYVTQALLSRFVLCPRGHAQYTHRIAETMALGRVPVVLADGWIPFSIPEQDYFVRVPEADLGNLEQVLRALEPEAAARGRRAREVWCKYFSRETRAHAATDALRDLVARAPEPLTLAAYDRRWRSYRFRHANGRTLWQRAQRKLERTLKSMRLSGFRKGH
jgi:hypothetical protein